MKHQRQDPKRAARRRDERLPNVADGHMSIDNRNDRGRMIEALNPYRDYPEVSNHIGHLLSLQNGGQRSDRSRTREYAW